jgi:hypothetical protein
MFQQVSGECTAVGPVNRRLRLARGVWQAAGIARSLLAWAAILLVAGCQPAEDPALQAARQACLLSAEPAGAVGVLETRGKTAQGEVPVVLVGRIGSDAETTWDPGKAAFVVADLATPAAKPSHGGVGHDHENCPFCKAEKKSRLDSTALVHVVDAQGQPLPFDARKLLPLRAEQTVVVQGTATVDGLGNLVVKASGVFPRP